MNRRDLKLEWRRRIIVEGEDVSHYIDPPLVLLREGISNEQIIQIIDEAIYRVEGASRLSRQSF